MPAKKVEKMSQQKEEEIGVLPGLESKSNRNWWLAFSVVLLLTMWTRLYKVHMFRSRLEPLISYLNV